MQSGRLLVNGSDFYCGNDSDNPEQLAKKSDIPSAFRKEGYGTPLEMGTYIDMHFAGSTNDYDGRIQIAHAPNDDNQLHFHATGGKYHAVAIGTINGDGYPMYIPVDGGRGGFGTYHSTDAPARWWVIDANDNNGRVRHRLQGTLSGSSVDDLTSFSITHYYNDGTSWYIDGSIPTVQISTDDVSTATRFPDGVLYFQREA